MKSTPKKPTHVPTKRLYVGKSKICRPFVRKYEKILHWACSIKPGDYIATCQGCNRKVVSVKPVWCHADHSYDGKRSSNWYLSEVMFVDTHGYLHISPGGGCASPKEDPEDVVKYLTDYYQYVIQRNQSNMIDEFRRDLKQASKFLEYLAQGKAVVDEFGEVIPELDRYTT